MQPPDTVSLSLQTYISGWLIFFWCKGSHKDVQSLATIPFSQSLFTLKKIPDKSSHAVENVENTIKDPITGKVRGALYTNPFDCLWKTFKAEGIAGWYKGEFLNTL